MMKYTLVVLCGLVLSACTKETLITPNAGPPVIEFVKIEPTNVIEFKDSISVTFKYSDPDGDLGTQDPDLKLMSVLDARLNEPDVYHMPILSPPGSTITIEGEITMKLKNTFLLGSGGDEVTSYQIIVTDRAGNQSNPITTDPITITKE